LVHLRFLNLSENAFPSLPFDALQGLPLTELFAAKNKLSGVLITLDAIEFPILRTLDVSANSLTSLSSGSLSLPSLQLLTISANRLTHLPPVSTWTSLLTLSAADNSIAALPEGFVDLPHLKLADLQGNALRILDDRIALMESLDTLLVSGNPLREKKFSGMNTADLKRALAARLEPAAPEPEPEPAAEIEEFQHTRNTSAASVISVIRDSDSDTGTEYLDAPSTPTLPRSPSASEWSINATLGVLDRSYSQSYSLNPLVAAQIAGENKIRSIELHHNAFSEVPASIAFFGLTLTSLNLSHNGLTSDNFVKDEIELPVLRELNLSSNTFNSLSPLLRYLKAGQLEKLDVSFNRLTTLPILRGQFPALAIVLASNNTIRELNPEAVRGLRSVDVGSNELGSLNPRLGLIKGLDRLEVGGNRFRVPGWRVLEKGTGSLLEWLRGRIPVGELEEEEREGEGEGEVD
jgi:Leucine-rich repeat (LRR) protein